MHNFWDTDEEAMTSYLLPEGLTETQVAANSSGIEPLQPLPTPDTGTHTQQPSPFGEFDESFGKFVAEAWRAAMKKVFVRSGVPPRFADVAMGLHDMTEYKVRTRGGEAPSRRRVSSQIRHSSGC